MIMSIRNKMKSQKGFTLIELMVVISIIGILAAIVVPKFSSATDSATKAKIQADLRTLDSAISMYYAKNGSYPTTIGALKPNFLAEVPSPGTYKGASLAAYDIDDNDTTTPANNTYRAFTTVGSTKVFADTTTAW